MGVSLGTSSLYVVISLLPERETTWQVRRAVHIGRVKTFAELDNLMEKYEVFRCLISPQAEPHLVQEWARQDHHGSVYQVIYTNDGLSQPEWRHREKIVRVDRTHALDSAYAEIRARRWWLPPGAQGIDGGEFYAQLKAPTRVRDKTVANSATSGPNPGPSTTTGTHRSSIIWRGDITRLAKFLCCKGGHSELGSIEFATCFHLRGELRRKPFARVTGLSTFH
jgi:hypothetical protein